MSEEIHNFEIGKTFSSDDMTPEEQKAILGFEISKSDAKEKVIGTVVSVDRKTGTITISLEEK